MTGEVDRYCCIIVIIIQQLPRVLCLLHGSSATGRDAATSAFSTGTPSHGCRSSLCLPPPLERWRRPRCLFVRLLQEAGQTPRRRVSSVASMHERNSDSRCHMQNSQYHGHLSAVLFALVHGISIAPRTTDEVYFGAAWHPESTETWKAGTETEQTVQHIACKKKKKIDAR